MSIIIKGMEMPKEESITIQILPSGAVYLNSKLAYEAGAVEIPTPHGRLIDIKSVEDRKFTTVDNEYERWWNGALDSVVDNAPTVIEAEGSEE